MNFGSNPTFNVQIWLHRNVESHDLTRNSSSHHEHLTKPSWNPDTGVQHINASKTYLFTYFSRPPMYLQCMPCYHCSVACVLNRQRQLDSMTWPSKRCTILICMYGCKSVSLEQYPALTATQCKPAKLSVLLSEGGGVKVPLAR